MLLSSIKLTFILLIYQMKKKIDRNVSELELENVHLSELEVET